MPRPTDATAVGRPDLGALAYEHMMDQSMYIGLSIMPLFQVPEQSMQYPVIPIESLIKSRDNTARAARAGYARADWQFEFGTFACAEHGWEELVDDKERNLYQRFFDAEVVATEIATGVILRNHEARVAAVLTASTNTTAAGVTWATAATATPKANIKTAINEMRAAGGVRPNKIVMSWTTFTNVLVTNELRDYLQYTSPHLVEGLEAQRATLARYFGVDEVLVGDVLEDTAKRGKAASLADLWPDDEVYLVAVNDSNNLRMPSVGRTFQWIEDAPDILTTESYRDETKRSNVVRVRHNVAEAVQYAGAIRKLTGTA